MLAVSAAASTAISKALQAVSLPEGAGLRLAADGVTDRGTAIQITFVTDAAPDDQVVDIGAPAGLFLEPVTAELLEGQVLDARTNPDGLASFFLRPQRPAGDG